MDVCMVCVREIGINGKMVHHNRIALKKLKACNPVVCLDCLGIVCNTDMLIPFGHEECPVCAEFTHQSKIHFYEVIDLETGKEAGQEMCEMCESGYIGMGWQAKRMPKPEAKPERTK